MLIRMVKMTFKPDTVDAFLAHFYQHKNTIRHQPGCCHLSLLRDADHPNRFYTYSLWESEKDLNNYRQSGFFKEVWGYTKTLFAEKPEAWSMFESQKIEE